MPGTIENYRGNDYINKSKSDNSFVRKKKMVFEKDISESKRDQYILWNTFFRRNIHRFIEMVLEIKLFPYQIIWVYLMSISDVFVSICARAASKSFLVACYTLSKAILYPNSEILIVASTIKQASLIVDVKIRSLRDMSPILQREIIDITSNPNKNECALSNGSTIKVVAANEGSRGNRATTLLMDEFLLLKKEVVDGILVPFLYVRVAPFMKLSEYRDYPKEEPQVISISSAGFKSDWGYRYTVSVIKMMLEGKKAGFFAVDYLISIESGIKTASQIETERRSSDPETFSREYENVFSGESSKAYFKHSMFSRKIKKPFYPLRQDLLMQKKNPFSIPKQEGEVRVIGYDLAARLNKANDNSVLVAIRCFPTKQGHERHVVYVESSHGSNVISQGIRLKDVFYDFEADYLVLDIAQNGIGLYDSMSKASIKEETQEKRDGFTVMDHYSLDNSIKDELRGRTLGIENLRSVVYPISASQKLNSEIAVALRSSLQKKLFSFLVSDIDAEDYLIRSVREFKELTGDDSYIRSWYLHPYIQTNLMIMECINLESTIVNGLIKLSEGAGRKDRYSALSYANFFISEVLDSKLLKQDDSENDWELLQRITQFF